MSKGPIIREGSEPVAAFASTLSTMPPLPRSRKANDYNSLRETAHKEGYASGYELGFATGKAEGEAAGYQAGFDAAYAEHEEHHRETLRRFSEELQTVHDRIERQLTEWFEVSERELESIAVRIAEKLVDAQLRLDRSLIVEATKNALQQLSEARQVRIRVNPYDSVILNGAKEDLAAASASLRGIEIVDDASIYGGCVIESDRGVVDATVETRLQLLDDGLGEAA